MLRSRRFLTILTAVAVLASSFAAKSLAAQPTKKKDTAKKEAKSQIIGDQPIAIINAASANRMLGDVERTFKSIDKTEIIDMINTFIGGFGDLKGIDRDKPFGVMLFLNAGIPPTPAPVGYIPVKNMPDLVKSLSNGPFTVKPVEDLKDRYKITGPNRTVYIGVKGKYAFVTDNIDSLDREFPDPVKFAEPLAKRYDLSFSVNFNSVAKESRELFATLLRASAEAELQKRDDESETAYQSRRADNERNLEWIEALLLDCETLLIGLDASAEKKNLIIETAVDARANSKFAKMIKGIGGKKTYFDGLLSEKSPLSVSVSVGLDNKVDREKSVQNFRMLAATIDFGMKRVINDEKKTEPEKRPGPEKKEGGEEPKKEPPRRRFDPRYEKTLTYPVGSPIARVLEPIMDYASKRQHFDFFLQIVGEPPEKFAMLGGLQVMDGQKMAGGLADFMRQLQKLPRFPEVTVNAETHKGIAFHRVRLPSDKNNPMNRFFGDSPSVFVGATSRAVWVLIGSEPSFKLMRKTLDTVLENKDVGKVKPKSNYPFRVAVNVGQWLAMAGDDAGPGRQGRELAKKAFEKGGDGIRIEARTVENGMRARVQLDEGFIKFIGLNIARQIERSRPPAP